MKYIRVENNSIVDSPTDLPTNAHNISNFYLLPQETLKSYGWYPFEIQEIKLNENEVIIRWETTIEETKVVRRPIKRSLTEEEINKKNEDLLKKQWEEVRNNRNTLLYESDWTQIPDAPISEQNKYDWKLYRQNLRDVTNASNPKNVIWPTKPDVIKPDPVATEPPLPPPVEETSEEEVDLNLLG